MNKGKKREVYVIGHKNPDTDSICSAIAYAELKNRILRKLDAGEDIYQFQDFLIDGTDSIKNVVYVPARAGQVSTETAYVLHTFNQKAPVLMEQIRTQVADINVRRLPSIKENDSLKKAWETMRASETSTLAITDEEKSLKGIITTSDIAASYMSVLDNRVLGEAKTPIANIIETIEGTLETGDPNMCLNGGKMSVSTATLEVSGNFMEEGDIVILGNRYDAQLQAIEHHVSCLIICNGSKISKTIKKMAQNNGVCVICSPLDTFTVTRAINQSIPVKHFMISDNITTFPEAAYISDIKPIMSSKRFRDFPIADAGGRYVGMISRRSLIDMESKKVILVDHNEMDQASEGIEEAEVLEIIDHHKLGTVETIRPVKVRNEPVGCTGTIVYMMYLENDITVTPEIAGLLCSAILSDTLMFRSPTCTPVDQMAAETLAEIAGIQIEEYALKMFEAGSQLRTKSDSEILYQDYKNFTAGETFYGVGQVTAMSKDELYSVQERLTAFMKDKLEHSDLSMMFFMLTDILTESTRLLFVGKDAKETVQKAFSQEACDTYIDLEKVVSRKKQLIPNITLALQ